MPPGSALASGQPRVYLSDLQRLFDALALRCVAIIGTSRGGLLGMMLSVSAPQRVEGIVLHGIGPQVDPAGHERIRGYTGQLPPVSTWDEAIERSREIYGHARRDRSAETWARLIHRGFSIHCGEAGTCRETGRTRGLAQRYKDW